MFQLAELPAPKGMQHPGVRQTHLQLEVQRQPLVVPGVWVGLHWVGEGCQVAGRPGSGLGCAPGGTKVRGRIGLRRVAGRSGSG